MSREAFLDRVRQAAQVGQAHRVHLYPVPPEVGYVGCEGDLCERFATEVAAVGGEAHSVPDLPAARGALEKLLDELHPARSAGGTCGALCWQHELLTRLGLDELLESRGMVRHDYRTLATLSPEKRRETMLACQVGITSCDCAIAETGSLLVCSRSGRERLASLLPPVHVAIVERSQIVPDLIDAIGLLSRRGVDHLPSNAVLITGPSKTGDIELQLTTGVHGPGKWHVIVVCEPCHAIDA